MVYGLVYNTIMQLKHWIILLIILFYIAGFIFRAEVTLDPDFGWHLQFGRMITKTHTIPRDDLYSYSMPSYHFIDHEWGTDSMIAGIYDKFGITALNGIFALLGVGTLYFLSRGIDVRWAGVPLFLVGGTILEFIGIRPQIITWTLLALLMGILWQKKVWQKWRFAIPILFLFWANIHGGFAIGIVILGWFVIVEAISNRRIDAKDGLVLLLSVVATLCNPYGYHLWVEVAKSATDSNLRWSIQEWYPAVYFTNLAFWLYVVISFFLVIRYRRKFSPAALGIYALLFVSGMSSMRNIPIFVVVSFYPTLQGIQYLYAEAGDYLYGKERFVRGYIGFFLICLFLYLPQLGAFVYGTIRYGDGQNSYPRGAASYLSQHLPPGNIFASYDWGGFLIWQLPEKKEFIDGRMPSWRNQSAFPSESTYAFGDYQKILQGTIQFASVSKKYDIDTVLVSTSDTKVQHLKILGIDVEKNAFLKRFFTSNTSFAPVITQIKKMGWKEVYHDKTAIVFKK